MSHAKSSRDPEEPWEPGSCFRKSARHMREMASNVGVEEKNWEMCRLAKTSLLHAETRWR